MTNVIINYVFFIIFHRMRIFYLMISDIQWKALFVLFSIVIATIDIKTGKVPRAAFIIAFPAFFILRVLLDERRPSWMLIAGCLTGLIIFLIVFFISGKRLGLADVWYSALIGLVLGLWWWYAAMGSACIAGIVYLLISRQRRIPFIPFMALGSIITCIIHEAF